VLAITRGQSHSNCAKGSAAGHVACKMCPPVSNFLPCGFFIHCSSAFSYTNTVFVTLCTKYIYTVHIHIQYIYIYTSTHLSCGRSLANRLSARSPFCCSEPWNATSKLFSTSVFFLSSLNKQKRY